MAIIKGRATFIQQGWLRALIFCAAYILATWLTGIIAGSALAIGVATQEPTAVNVQTITIMMLMVISVVSIVLAVVFRLYVDRQPVTSLGISRVIDRNELLTGLLLGTALMGAGSLILHLAGSLQWTDANFQGADFFLALILMIIVAVSEEMVFRGYLLNNLMESMNKWAALLVSAVLFTIAHSLNPNLNPLALINLFLGGLLLGINFIYTKQLWFAIGLHFAWNFLQGYVLGFAVSGFSEQTLLQQQLKGHPILTGDGFGIEGSIAATIVLAAAITICYLAFERKYAK